VPKACTCGYFLFCPSSAREIAPKSLCQRRGGRTSGVGVMGEIRQMVSKPLVRSGDLASSCSLSKECEQVSRDDRQREESFLDAAVVDADARRSVQALLVANLERGE
jgi:hypothetical protein